MVLRTAGRLTVAAPSIKATNWASADAGPGRVLDDIRLVDWKDAESFRRARATWLLSIRRSGDVKQANMVWLLHIVSGYMKQKNDAAWPSIARLAAELGWSEPTVKRALALAIEWGWLIRERRYDKSNRYFMSFSESVVAEIEDQHAVRMMPFADKSGRPESASDPDIDDEGGEIKPDLTVGSNLISPSDQVRSHREIKPDLLYQRPIPFKDTVDPYLTDPLGETEQDRSQGRPRLPSPSPSTFRPDEDDSDHSPRHELIEALGDGDVREGRLVADALGPQRCAFLMELVVDVGAWRAGPQIREAAADARARLMPTISQPGVMP